MIGFLISKNRKQLPFMITVATKIFSFKFLDHSFVTQHKHIEVKLQVMSKNAKQGQNLSILGENGKIYPDRKW